MGGSNVPIYTKISYDLTIAIVNKCCEFQNDWFKIMRIWCSCMQFCLIPPSQRNKKKKRTMQEVFEQHAPKSYEHQIISRCNRILSFLNFLALVLDIQCPQNFGDIRHTYRHFLKMVKSCIGHLKTCQFIENRMLKIFMNPVLCSNEHRRKEKFITLIFMLPKKSIVRKCD